MRIKRLRAPTLVVAVVALVVGVSSGAMGAKLITGKDIKDGSVKSADITNGTLVTKDLKKNGVSADRLKKGGFVKVERSGLVLTDNGKKEASRAKYNADAAGASYG